MIKILVTGSSGFIGKKIVNQLSLDNSIVIIRTTRNKKDVSKNILYYDIYDCKFDINLYEFYGKPDILLHCAWDDVKNINRLDHVYQQSYYHIKFLENLISNGLKKTVVLGTCFEYGKLNGELSENQAVNPVTSYAIAKNAIRIHIESHIKKQGNIFQWIRVFYTYDKTGKTGNNIVHHLKKAIDKKENLFNMTNGEKKLDFIEVNELSYLIKKIILQNEINGIINCCSGKPQTTLNLVKSCLKVWNKKIKLNTGFYSYRDYEPDYFYGNISKLNKILK